MKRIYLSFSLISLLLTSLAGFSQISQGGLPLSFKNPQGLAAVVPVETMPAVDVNRLVSEDSLNDIHKDVPWRFGENIDVDLGLNNSGHWDVLSNGDRIWRLGIACPGAFSINLTFDHYVLPSGATLFVYNLDRSSVIGAFTDYNNRNDSVFATTLLPGDQITIEYFEPAGTAFHGLLHLNRVTHGYRDGFSYIKSFGQSGSCNNNVKCPEADSWQNQVNSACMLVTGGSGFCSGALVNNTSQDGTPFILTANHCYSNPASWVFWFNWQSPTCTNPSTSPPYNSISGATLKARNSASDFCLVQMSSVPPANYSVYYAGWNKADIAAASGAGIHHPSGDIKKISYSNQAFASSSWSGTPADSHWQVFWTDGITEPGSSGSPMFDQYHHIIGQLHGGPSSCSSSQEWDFYGKFAMSWEYGSSSSSRLKEWLDPTNIGGDTLGGFDPNIIPIVHTLAATGVSVSSATLNGTVNPMGLLTSYHFEWGTTNAFGNSTPTLPVGSGSTPVPVTEALTGLSSGTQYFFRAVGTTASGVYNGDTMNFVTSLPTLTVTPSDRNVSSASGNTEFYVTSNISWAVTSDTSWCNVTASGTDNDTIFTNYTENLAVTSRIAHITVTGTGVPAQVVTVTQEGAAVILNVDPPTRNVGSPSGNTTFTVTSNTNWTVSGNAGWITFTPSGTGNDTIHVTFTENTVITGRTATITVSATGIGSVDVTVVQSGATPILNVTPANQNVTYVQGGTDFSVTSNTDWTVVSDVAWCTVTSGGSGNGTIVANYLENTTTLARSATISVSAASLPVQTVTVTQAKSSAGIGEQESNELKIIPNPTKGRFRIMTAYGDLGNMEVQVVDIGGRLILKRSYRGEKEYEVDLSSASAGTYQVIIKSDDTLLVRKLVIIK
ncbi:MAG: BACON domain-containing carbohydrate-binding protein [Bacteroidetes bacterium]|nr:BACON domain-containing carbohydrate-binding protein [Bacteroidota bacterium]